MAFAHLHVHTEYSLLDGASRVKELIRRTKELGMDSVAITDHGVMYGAVRFYKEAKAQGITRSMAAMRSFGKALDGAIIAIGNAPTALFEVLRMVEEEGIRPAAIVGIPVGFVGAADSKELLAKNDKVPYITVEGTKGGSPIAASVVNAVMYLIDNTR